jgi:hypothetical protein
MARYRDAAQRLVRSLIIAFAYSPTPCGRAPSFGGSFASRFTSGNNNWTPTESDFSRRDYSSCFGGSSYQTEMAITATLRFTGLPVR